MKGGAGLFVLGHGVAHIPSLEIVRVHKSVEGSFFPSKIMLLLLITSLFTSSNVTVHPALHMGLILINDAIAICGMMCPIRFGGSWKFDVTFMR